MIEAELHLQAGDPVVAGALLERALPGAAGVERARILLRRAQTLDDAVATLDFLEQALLAGADDLLVAEIEMERAGVRLSLGDVGAARREARSGVRAARSAGDRLLVAFAVAQSSLFDVVGGGLPDLAALAAAEEVEREAFVWPSAYPPSLVLGMCLMYADRLDEARKLLQAADLRMGKRGRSSSAAQPSFTWRSASAVRAVTRGRRSALRKASRSPSARRREQRACT